MAALKIDGYNKVAVIKKRVRQQYSLFPLLLSLFIKYGLQDVKEKIRAGIKIQGKTSHVSK